MVDRLRYFFFNRRLTSGKWRFSHLLPVMTIACAGIWWLGERGDSVLLLVFGVLGTVVFGLANLIVWIPREVGEWSDFRSYIAKRERIAKEAEDKKAMSENKEA